MTTEAITETLMHVVGFSGGIDSQAAARWLLNRYPPERVVLLNSDAGGNEHPMTTEFVKTYSETIHPVVIISSTIADLGNAGQKSEALKDRRNEFADTDDLTFDRLAYIKGRFPSRTAQFCTEYLKIRPAARWIQENLTSKGIAWQRYSGVRRDESRSRSKRLPVAWDDYLQCTLHLPIVDWTKQMCFDYVKHHGEPVNQLYTLGFDRVGCAPCVNSGKDDVLAWFQRFPEMIDKVRDWEKRTGLTFFPPMVPGLALNWIDDVVKWAKTAYGGKQFDLLKTIPRAACESEYGLCE